MWWEKIHKICFLISLCTNFILLPITEDIHNRCQKNRWEICSASFYSFVNRDMNVLATYLLINKKYNIVFKFIKKIPIYLPFCFLPFFLRTRLIKKKIKLKMGKVRHRYKKPIACDPVSKSLFFEARLVRRRGSLGPSLLGPLPFLFAIATYSLWAELGFTEQRENKEYIKPNSNHNSKTIDHKNV